MGVGSGRLFRSTAVTWGRGGDEEGLNRSQSHGNGQMGCQKRSLVVGVTVCGPPAGLQIDSVFSGLPDGPATNVVASKIVWFREFCVQVGCGNIPLIITSWSTRVAQSVKCPTLN